MDLLYLLGGGSKHNDVELRYSLRSIEKNCTGYDRVILVGRKPEWVQGVEFYSCADDMGCAHKNMMKKILHACKESDISEEFVMQADDHFYVKPYDFKDIKPYHKGELPTTYRNPERAKTYRKSLIDTRRFLESMGYPVMNGSQHCGMPFRRSLWLEIERTILNRAFNYTFGLESSSIMINAMTRHFGIEPVYREDKKFKNFSGEGDLAEKIGDGFCFSIYDGAFDNGIEKILQVWFPEKSKYEK